MRVISPGDHEDPTLPSSTGNVWVIHSGQSFQRRRERTPIRVEQVAYVHPDQNTPALRQQLYGDGRRIGQDPVDGLGFDLDLAVQYLNWRRRRSGGGCA